MRDGLVELYADWIRRYKIDGFRIDTARHVEPTFFGYWVPKILAAARSAGVNDFQLFGEAFIRDAVELSSYVRDRGLPNVIDFPMQDALARFAGGSAGATGIASRLNDDDYFVSPDGVSHVPPTFLGNHDIGRAAQQVLSLGAGSGGPILQRTLLAYDLLYLLRGAPTVYYGDEFGIVGRGGDKEARHDLFPTQVAEWQTEPRVGSPPVGTGSSFDLPENPIATRLRQLGRLRAEHAVLSTGATIVRRASRTTLAVSRIDAAGKREYLALFNAGGSPARMTIATATPQAEWTRLLGTTTPASSTRTGALTLTVPAYSSALLQATRQIPRRATKPVLKVARDSLSSLVRVSATAGSRPVSVSFAVRRAGRWTRIAADDSPPYRTFLDPAKFRRGERVDLVAIVRTLQGRTAVSPRSARTFPADEKGPPDVRPSRSPVAHLPTALPLVGSASASHTPAPSSVTIAGSLQSELGCPGDWQPDCAATHLAYDAADDVWQRTFDVPAGSWEYKAPLNDSWTENYGQNATRDGPNIALNLASAASVKFYYDHKSHWITSNRNTTIAVAPGSFQSELGCPGDWDPSCLRSWLQDPDGNGTYSFTTTAIPPGSYEAKVAIDEAWTENYGQGGVRDGANIPFTVPAGPSSVTFSYDGSTTSCRSPSPSSGGGSDNNVEWDGVRHDSRDLLYRTPGGRFPRGTPVRLRLRTFHDDVTSVSLRLFDVNAGEQRLVDAELAART